MQQENAPSPEDLPPRPICYAYIDGFNLYYGMLEDHPEYKWLNCRRLLQLLRPNDDLVSIKYFTAEVDAKRQHSEQRDRQKRYWKALSTLPNFQLIQGKISERERTCKARECSLRLPYQDKEEKQTDVNIALAMVTDAIDHQPGQIVIISGDSDLIPAAKMIQQRSLNTRIAVYIPAYEEDLAHRRLDEYRPFCSSIKPIPEKFLRMAQFPNQVSLPNSQSLSKPPTWT
jgi:uncharacterized LabA/DUF88 family protein